MNTFKITKEDLGVQEAPSAVKVAQELYRKLDSVIDEWEYEITEEHLYIWLPKYGFLGGTAMSHLVNVTSFFNLSFYASFDSGKQRMFVVIYLTRK